jgi:hypothetical protein
MSGLRSPRGSEAAFFIWRGWNLAGTSRGVRVRTLSSNEKRVTLGACDQDVLEPAKARIISQQSLEQLLSAHLRQGVDPELTVLAYHLGQCCDRRHRRCSAPLPSPHERSDRGQTGANNASELRTRLSVLLDSGRLFFPNQPEVEEEDQPAAETAYVGQSHEAIDALYRVYRVISDLGRETGLNAADAVLAVVAQRRRFVSEVFRSIDPRRRDAAFEALTARSLA